MNAYRITPVAREDLGDLLRLIHGLAEFESLTHLLEVDETRLEAALLGERPCSEALLVRSKADNQAVAFACWFQNFSTFLGKPGLYLEDVYVAPEHRRQGIGKAILSHLASLAVRRDCGRFEWSVLDWNTPAQDFYQTLGASIMPEWRIVRITGPQLQQLATLA